MNDFRTTILRTPAALAAATLVTATLLLSACGSSGTSSRSTESGGTEAAQTEEAQTEASKTEEAEADAVQAEVEQPLTEEEVSRWTTGGASYVGREATVTGKVFNMDHDGDTHVYQIHADTENYDGNTIIYYEGADPGINKNDYIRATGIVAENMQYENAFGATMSAPLLAATSVEKSTYQDIVSPTIAFVEPNLVCELNGYTVTVSRVEFAANETRVYVGLTNNGAGRLTVYDYNAVIIQDGKQYNTERNYSADYPSINNEVAIGASLDGIISFPAIEQRSFQLQLRGHSDNYQVDGSELSFTFDIAV